MASLQLILGGVRSGKSRFAQQLAEGIAGENVVFLATAAAGDEEMRHRIHLHQQQRPRGWLTVEAPLDVATALRQTPPRHCYLIDCLTLFVSNVMLSVSDERGDALIQDTVERAVTALIEACRQIDGTVIIVSGEVGCGVVPATRLGRLFRDLLGRANQVVAAEAHAVYTMVAGLALEVKARAVSAAAAVRAAHHDK